MTRIISLILKLLDDKENNNREIRTRTTQPVIDSLVGITHDGINEHENAIRHPDEQAEYSPTINIFYVEHMEGSQIQQGTILSSQYVHISTESKPNIANFINLLKEHLEELGLERRDETEIKADISTIEAQINSSRPKTSILKESISSIKRILEGAVGSIVAVELLKYIPPILDKLG